MTDNQNYQYSPDRQPQQHLVTTTTHLLQKQLSPQITNNHVKQETNTGSSPAILIKTEADNHQTEAEKDIKKEEKHLIKEEDENPNLATTPKNYQNNFLGRLTSKDNILFISQNLVEIGRNSSKSSVDYNVGKNSFISRKHLQIQHNSGEFVLVCLSKNGVFVDGIFQRKTSEPLKLAKICTFRFPSTNIRIQFENLINQNIDTKSNIKTENPNLFYSPLKITIPEIDGKSPFPSPTGTISAVNSCPTSPRQGFPEYPSYANINQNNNNNNFQNEMFQPPSTSSYSEHEKPPYSYAQLIVQSISASPEKQLTLSGIYSFISKNYPYYRTGANKGWQNSIRHNLSLNRYFIKVPRSQDEPGKGSFWRIDPNSEMKLIDSSYRKRRQRGSQCFRSPFGMPRSAPVSPSHIDNSRENSPLHDITMQSAPGSPGVHYHSMHNENHEEGTNYPAQTIIQQTPYTSHQFK